MESKSINITGSTVISTVTQENTNEDRSADAIYKSRNRQIESIKHKGTMSKHAGSIHFSDDEFSEMLQTLKDDK
jgi:hypothetical protein